MKRSVQQNKKGQTKNKELKPFRFSILILNVQLSSLSKKTEIKTVFYKRKQSNKLFIAIILHFHMKYHLNSGDNVRRSLFFIFPISI